jgi:hypothetical protein
MSCYFIFILNSQRELKTGEKKLLGFMPWNIFALEKTISQILLPKN